MILQNSSSCICEKIGPSGVQFCIVGVVWPL